MDGAASLGSARQVLRHWALFLDLGFKDVRFVTAHAEANAG
ncbi:MAG TPA: hypothetical protein VEY88_09105 [Archangium sp.]|nr:hypothetical protein [Archangium sp.]